MNVQLLKHNRGRDIKSYLDLLINVSPSRIKMAFWRKTCCFQVEEFSERIFSSNISRFSAGIRLSRPADGLKKSGLTTLHF